MVRLRVLGTIELQDADGREVGAVLAQPKRLAFLVYLALGAPGYHRRDTLRALFWPDVDDTRARDALNSAVRFLRRALGAATIVSRGVEELAIDPTRLWCDAMAFRDHASAGRFGEALDLYRGDLLAGFFSEGGGGFEEWLERERARLRSSAAKAARALAEARESESNFTTAVAIARRAVDLSDLDERVVRELLELLDRLGDRAGAIHAYDEFARRLARELDAEPAAETKALVDRIRQRTAPATRERPSPAAATVRASQPGRASLEPGSSLGGWRIEGEIGRGGMATVYLARDRKHDRHVALKTMRPELAATLGADRFVREIRITARLAHPHILPLIDSGVEDGVLYLVTPYVAGESLRARLTREGKLPLADALRVASEVAEALDYAHRSGIIHRDIKPENILLADGHAIVADFGVARAVLASEPATEARATDVVVVGSPPYMSPEALAGEGASVRTDVYSLGCVLFEMLAGAPPRDGPASPVRLEPGVPKPVRHLVADCLAPRLEARPASAGDVLRRLVALSANATPARASRRAGARAWRRVLIGGAIAVSGFAFAVSRTPRAAAGLATGEMTKVTTTAGLELDPAISPDGKMIAFAAGTPGRMRIHVRQLAGGRVVEVSGNEMRHHRWPSWSPDGGQIAFVESDGDRGQPAGRIVVVPALGGPPRVIGEAGSYFATPAWSPDGGAIAYPVGDSIVVRSVRDSTRRTLRARPGAHSLVWSPDGTRLAFVSGNAQYTFASTAFGNLSPSSIWTVALDGGPPTPIVQGTGVAVSPVWMPDGRGLLYASNAGGAFDVYQVSIDAGARPTSAARRLTTGLNVHGISLSRDGTRIAYSVLNYRSNIYAAPIAESGQTPAAAIQRITDENQTIETADISQDGAWLAFDSNRDGRSHIYKMAVAGGEPVQLSRDTADDFAPRWSPDGSQIAFHSRRTSRATRDVYVMRSDGSGVVQISTDSVDDSYPRWAPDGRTLVFMQASAWMMSRLGTDGRWSAPMKWRARSGGGVWTPNGRYLVLVMRGDLYVEPRGGKPRRIVTASDLHGRISGTAVGSDPTAVYFRLIDSAGVHSFYSVSAAGGTPRLVVRLEETARMPARIIFSTDGRRLYFTLTEAESDIWVMRLRRS